jgi:acyl-CoA thioester hydrolase
VISDSGFQYRRRVQFAETDLAGIVHFSAFFRFMEEAEHALWRAAGVGIGAVEQTGGWPRVAAAFEYKKPLRFEEEFDVTIRIAATTARSLRYGVSITRGDELIGTGTMTAVCTSKDGGRLRAVEIPAGLVARLRAAAGQDAAETGG